MGVKKHMKAKKNVKKRFEYVQLCYSFSYRHKVMNNLKKVLYYKKDKII